MLAKLSNSWELVKASARVLRSDTELLLFPLMSGMALILVTLSFFVPLALIGAAASRVSPFGLGVYVAVFVFYFIQYFIIIFFNSALVGAALIRLNGGDPTLSDGLRIAWSRVLMIALYALIAATVGVILRAVKEKGGLLGKILATLGGLAWSLATFFVVPILVSREIDPIEAIKESARIFRRNWGEQIAGSVGISFFFGILTFVYSLFAIGGIVMAVFAGLPIYVIGLILGVAALGYVTLALVSSALGSIYSAALYRFATTGETGFFEPGLLKNAFQTR